MTKKILIDFEKSLDPYSGLGQFCLFLKKEFEKSKQNIEYFIPENSKLCRIFPFLIPSSEIFHGIHQDSPYVPFFKETKYILTIHDLNAILENENESFKKKYLKKLQKKVNRADTVTFISHFTKSECRAHLNLEHTKTEVIYNGIALPIDSIRPTLVPTKKYFFTIGTVLPKKNFHVLINLMKHFPEYQLIIAGSLFHQYAKDMMTSISENKLSDRVLLIGTIKNEEKKWYYENAHAFIFPSLFEGFGLPVAEAMSFGLPLFLSKETSIPEIGGSDAFYFESFDDDKMSETIKKGLLEFNIDQKQRLIERSKMFDWKQSAKSYLDIYNRL